jgi:hypothetical protein
MARINVHESSDRLRLRHPIGTNRTTRLTSASATPSTLALQRNRHAKSLPRIIFLDRIRLVDRLTAVSPLVNVPAPDATRGPLFADLTPKNSRPSLRSEMMRILVVRLRLV